MIGEVVLSGLVLSLAVLIFLGGVCISDWIGWHRHKWTLQRGIDEGRLKLTTTRAYYRSILMKTKKKGRKR